MKRFTAVVLSAAMIAALGVQTLAAPSISVGDNSFQTALSPENEGLGDDAYVTWAEEDKLTEENYTPEMLEFVKYLNNLEEGISVLEAFESYEGFEEPIDLSKIKLFDGESEFVQEGFEYLDEMYFLSPVKELQWYNVEPTEKKPVKVDFTANDMTEEMGVYVLTLCPDDEWELLETERKSDNQVTASFHAKNTLTALIYMEKSADEEAEGTSPRT